MTFTFNITIYISNFLIFPSKNSKSQNFADADENCIFFLNVQRHVRKNDLPCRKILEAFPMSKSDP